MEEQYGKTKILFDTFVCDPIPVNRFIYRSWLEGLTEKETAARRDSIEKSLISPLNQSISGVSTSALSSLLPNTFVNNNNNNVSSNNLQQTSSSNINNNNNNNTSMINTTTMITNTNMIPGSSSNSNNNSLNSTSTNIATTATWQQLLEETEDQFRNFSLLRNVLEHPKTLSPHSMFQVDPTSRRLLIEGYYDFDDTFIRELIGRKLTSGQRRDLDDTSEKLRIRLSTCERQFDNLKRISRLVFANIKSSPIDLIINEFCLSRDLSKKYIKILFLCFHRIDISHKRIQPLNTGDLMKLAEIVMNNWGDPLRSYSMELEIKLKEDVRDLKVYLSKDIPERYLKMIKAKYQNPSSSSVGQSPKINSSLNLPSPLLMNQQQQPMTTTTTTTSTSNLGQSVQPTPSTQSNNTSLNNSNSFINTPSSVSSAIPPLPTSAFSLAQHVPAIVGADKLKALEDIIEKIVDPLLRIGMTTNEADTFFVFLRESFLPDNLGLTLRHKDRLV
ncbi:hypothetical protein DFA_08798 [Cavenderia fasciculata]|uniref:Uncharacterized protein n=1 Tax=Cavenderia fasciculata TaxID=261658 RepID=F4Q496_CACFS|nr:uncharacterized protein DFA_08798 [Cavenderia fasciculata]EGG17798.1 hypothetical protein DFA_08798 [Cavenderia fasciculata]|eukprot:XP_004356282.1 hypothetical protein DFA_08798 [Cavenderia fasciculata]